MNWLRDEWSRIHTVSLLPRFFHSFLFLWSRNLLHFIIPMINKISPLPHKHPTLIHHQSANQRNPTLNLCHSHTRTTPSRSSHRLMGQSAEICFHFQRSHVVLYDDRLLAYSGVWSSVSCFFVHLLQSPLLRSHGRKTIRRTWLVGSEYMDGELNWYWNTFDSIGQRSLILVRQTHLAPLHRVLIPTQRIDWYRQWVVVALWHTTFRWLYVWGHDHFALLCFIIVASWTSTVR